MRDFIYGTAFGMLLAALLLVGGCQWPPAQHPTPAEATHAYKATVLITVEYTDERALWAIGHRGTGWFVDDYLIVTAGHVCDVGNITYEKYDGSVGDAVVLKSIYDNGTGTGTDVCVMATTERAPARLTLGRSDYMRFGAPVWYVGYPQSVLAMFTGRLSGHTDDREYLTAAISGWYGASGAALLNERGEVIGVLSQAGTDNGVVIQFVPVEKISLLFDSN